MASQPLVPAAEYVRMSTGEQLSSIPIQKQTIRRYAASHECEIITTYADSGRSGIDIKHRTGLRQLVLDVLGGQAPFRTILVYDISRWGRFPDIDESAHYEFICRSMGISVQYCAEPFENNGTLASEIMKTLKRAMAAEYSRELAIKVSEGMRWLVGHGFRAGAIPGYGLRRMLVSAEGRYKQILQLHERKSITTDKVILVPGPEHEVEGVGIMFSLAADKEQSPRVIAEELNRRGIRFTGDTQWTEATVYRILKSEKYIGCNVWGKTKSPFRSYSRRLPPEEWIRKPAAFVPLVSADQFARVQELMERRRTKRSKPHEFLLNRMKEVLAREGKLTEALLIKYGYFDYRTYVKRFGSVMQAYQLVGYKPSAHAFASVNGFNKLKRLRLEVLTQLKGLFPSQLRVLRLTSRRQREIVELDQSLRVAVHICRPARPTLSGEPRWLLLGQDNERDLPCLICMPDESLRQLTAFYVVPQFGKLIRRCKILSEDHPWLAAGKRLDSLSDFCEVTKELAKEWKLRHDVIVTGDVVLTELTSTVTIAGHEIMLPSVEAALFTSLVQNAGCVVSRERLFEIGMLASRDRAGRSVHRRAYFLRNHMSILRRKLGTFGKRIVTAKYQGYVYQRTRRIALTNMDRFSPLLRIPSH